MNELKATTVYDAYWKATSVGEGTSIKVCLESEVVDYIADIVTKYEDELDKWYAKLCRNRWRRACAMFQYCRAMNHIECEASPATMEVHQFWRYHTAYWHRWMKRWFQIYQEYKERIE